MTTAPKVAEARRSWNGWGDASKEVHVPAGLLAELRQRLGPAAPPDDATLEEVLAKVPPSRLAEDPAWTTHAEDRLRHACGQGFADLVALRTGDLPAFPDAVAYPATSEEVRTVLQRARDLSARVIPWGGGTSVVGHVNPIPGAAPVITLDLGKLRALRSLDVEDRLATFGAGVAGPDLEAQLAARGYTLGHFPQSFELSTLGGWIATRSRGQQSLGYGRIEELFAGAEVETPEGPLHLAPHPSSSTGPDLRELVLGSEGRLGVITEATVRITPLPARETFEAMLFPSWDAALACVRGLAQDGPALSMLRLSAPEETSLHLQMALPASVRPAVESAFTLGGYGTNSALVVLAATGSDESVRHALGQARAACRKHRALPLPLLGSAWSKSRFKNPYLRNGLWEAGYGVETVETATTWSKLPALRAALEEALRTALANEGEQVHVFTHLSHVYKGGANVYTSFIFRLGDAPLARWRALKDAASRTISAQGATISHQHGVGTEHRPFLEAEKGALGVKALRSVFATFDPRGTLNPGKLV